MFGGRTGVYSALCFEILYLLIYDEKQVKTGFMCAYGALILLSVVYSRPPRLVTFDSTSIISFRLSPSLLLRLTNLNTCCGMDEVNFPFSFPKINDQNVPHIYEWHIYLFLKLN